MTYLMFALVAILYSAASYATYKAEIRNSQYFLYLMIVIAVISAFIWSYVVKRQTNNGTIAVLSMAWDMIIVVTYSVVPLLLNSRNAGWQFYLALSLSVFGLMWMKMLMEE